MNSGDTQPLGLLRSQWSRLGFRYACEKSENAVDLESALCNSVLIGREYPDVFWAALTWIIANGDLVNIKRLSNQSTSEARPLLGALIETALEHDADKRLKRVVSKQQPQAPAQVLFNVMASNPALSRREENESLPLFEKWGFYCSAVSLKSDALCDRTWILSHNRNLAFRAIFGPHARADILFALLKAPAFTIRNLSKTIGLSYQPVYSEVTRLLDNGLLSCQVWGRSKVVALSDSGRAFLNAVPPAPAVPI